MTERCQRTIVITGASRGLGLASAAHLYAQGWQVLAAMRSPAEGMARLREATGAPADDPRLTAITLDLTDDASIEAAAKDVVGHAGAPDVLVHNAGIAAVGCTEDMPTDVYTQVLTTNFLGPVALTKQLLPTMRAAGKGRIVCVSSVGGLHGMPVTGAYAAAKSALERWAESLAYEVAPFGLGVSVLVAGAYATDMVGDSIPQYSDKAGPYGTMYAKLDEMHPWVQKMAADPRRFARDLAKLLSCDAPFVKRTSGADARAMLIAHRLLTTRAFARIIAGATGVPKPTRSRPRARLEIGETP